MHTHTNIHKNTHTYPKKLNKNKTEKEKQPRQSLNYLLLVNVYTPPCIYICISLKTQIQPLSMLKIVADFYWTTKRLFFWGGELTKLLESTHLDDERAAEKCKGPRRRRRVTWLHVVLWSGESGAERTRWCSDGSVWLEIQIIIKKIQARRFAKCIHPLEPFEGSLWKPS